MGRALLGLSLLAIAFGVRGAEGEHRAHGAHEHGHGSIDIVMEGGEFLIELRIPGANVVGFEHEPATDEQREAVANTLSVFRRAGGLFVPPHSARCEVEAVAVELAGMAQHEGEAHEEHDGGEGHEEHGEDAEHEEHADEMHAELRGEYHFRCEAPDELDRLGVRVLEHLMDAEELAVRIVTPTLQTARELRPGEDAVLELTGR